MRSHPRAYRILVLFQIALVIASAFAPMTDAHAAPNYHLVGWFNTFVPGGGEALRGNFEDAAIQAPLEAGTFLWGYSLSPKKPLTLDGVPQDLPVAQTGFKTTATSQRVCAQFSVTTHKCIRFVTQTNYQHQAIYDSTPLDANGPAWAAILQEFGIKYHFINVFNSYRRTAEEQKETEYEGQSIDLRSTKDLFLDPFRWDNLSSPWVWAPLAMLTVATALDYRNQTVGGQAASLQPMTPGTNRLIAFNFIAWQPMGSGAPEEAFYRGFIQNEAYHVVPSPYFSIPVSASLFAYSHAPEGRLTAGVAGAYLGFLAHKNHGNLAEGIALHFWGVVVLGLETYLLTKYSQGLSPPITAQSSFAF